MFGGRGSGFTDSHSAPAGIPYAPNYGPLARALAWNTNAAGDTTLQQLMQWTNAIIEQVYYANPSVSLAASALVGTLRDAAAGGGNSLGSIAALTGLTSAPIVVPQALTVGRRITTGALFLNIGTPSGVVATCDVYVFGRILG